MAIALAGLWSLFLALGYSACVWPIYYTVSTAYQKAFDSGLSYDSPASVLGLLFVVNSIKECIKPNYVQFFLLQNSFVRTQKPSCNSFIKEIIDMSMVDLMAS